MVAILTFNQLCGVLLGAFLARVTVNPFLSLAMMTGNMLPGFLLSTRIAIVIERLCLISSTEQQLMSSRLKFKKKLKQLESQCNYWSEVLRSVVVKLLQCTKVLMTLTYLFTA